MITLHGVTWDHPRAVDSIRVASSAFENANPGVRIEWSARPLHEFEDAPIEELAATFDLLAIDHPLLGDAIANDALAPYDDFVCAHELVERSVSYVGSSFESYTGAGKQWALPVDAACMVSAFRPDQLEKASLPVAWHDVELFISELGSGRTLMAANPTHLWCTFLTLCEAVSAESSTGNENSPSWWGEIGFDARVFVDSFSLLRALLAASAPASLFMNPIAVLDSLASDSRYIYSPLVFEYSTYSLSRPGFGLVAFANAPRGENLSSGPLTGGVGLAISARSREPEWAARFALFATSDEVQRTVYSEAGGQPASSVAWADARVNEHANGMYVNTATSMENAFLRPRGRYFPAFQRAASALLFVRTSEGEAPELIAAEMNRIWGDRANL